MSATFYELMKYAKTGIAAPDMTAYDKAKALAMFGGGLSPYTIIGQPPISFLSDGTPLTSVTIKGNGVQNGTPSPQNIVPFDGTGVRTGNLCNPNLTRYEKAYSSNGIVDYSGGATYLLPIEVNTTYTIKIYSDNPIAVLRVGLYNNDTPITGTFVTSLQERLSLSNPTATVANSNYKYLFIQITGAYINQYGLSHVMVNIGPTPLPYEPYGWKVPFENRGENLWNFTIEQGGWSAAAGTIPAKILPDNPTYPIRCRVGYIMPIPSNTMSFTCQSDIKINFVWINANGVSLGGSGWQQSGSTVTAPENATSMTFILGKVDDSTCSPDYFQNIMLNLGSTPKPYSPYLNATIPVYLGEVPTVRRVKKLVLDGTEDWSRTDLQTEYAYFFIRIGDYMSTISDIVLSTHFTYTNITTATTGVGCDIAHSSHGEDRLVIRPNNVVNTSIADFTAYLASEYAAGHPVTIWYVLASPETGIVNEPLYKIGDYSDTLTTSTPIPTAKGSNELTVDTTVQPSEVSITGNIKPTT